MVLEETADMRAAVAWWNRALQRTQFTLVTHDIGALGRSGYVFIWAANPNENSKLIKFKLNAACEILQADVQIRKNASLVEIAHELGHTLGLDHDPPNLRSVMASDHHAQLFLTPDDFLLVSPTAR